MSDIAHTAEATLEDLAGDRRRQLRWLLTATAAGIFTIAAVMLLAGRLLIQRFAQMERDDALQKAAQLYHAADADFRQLSIINRNNAEWDDAVEFVATQSPGFLSSNFTATTMDGLHADLAWIIDRDGHSLYSGFYDRGTHKLSAPAPAALLQELQPWLLAPKDPSAADRAQLIRTSRGPLAVAATEITRTDRSQPTGATMILGRLLGAAEIARISDTSQLPLFVSLLDERTAQPAGMPEAVFRWVSDPHSAATNAWVASRGSINGYALIRDFNGAPVAVLSTPLPRNIYQLGLRTTSWLLGSIALAVILFTSAILVLVLRLRRTFAEHESARQRLRRLTQQMQDMVILADPTHLRILDANDAMLRKMNCSLQALRARRVDDLYPAFAAGQLDLRTLEPEGSFFSGTPMNVDGAAGSVADVTVTRLQEDEQQYLCFVGTDVTHRQQMDDLQRQSKRDLSHMAQHDALTGLPNRLYLQTRLRRTLRQALSGIELNAVYYLNLDEFTQINESRGQSVGDQLLQVVAKRLRALADAQHVIARVGGDEFVLVAPQLPDMAAVEALADKLQTVLQAPCVIDQDTLSMSASIGIALFPDHGNDMPTLLREAQIAMHSVKEAGGRSYALFSLDMNLRIKGRSHLMQSLKEAIGSAQFRMEYQPIYDMKSGRIASLEALVRWQHPELGEIPPATFIAVAEQSNQMLALGTQILDMVFSDLRQWQQRKVSIVPVAINLSWQQIERADFAAVVAGYCQQHAIEQCYVGFELPEDAFRHDLERMVRTLKQLRSRGSRIVIDDFGTGASNLTQLDTLPLDGLKLEQAFVQDVATNGTRLPMVRAIVGIAHNLGLTTVAVGVETVQQLALLTEQGCDFAQGFFLSRPIPASECQALLEHGNDSATHTLQARSLLSG